MIIVQSALRPLARAMFKSKSPLKSKLLTLTPTRMLVLSFLVLILICTSLLELPICYVSGQRPELIDVLFMGTSTSCITGLTTLDVANTFTRFGQAVILLFIHLGGLGMVMFTSSLLLLFGGRIGLEQRRMLQEYLPGIDMGSVVQVTRYVLVAFFTVELIGAAILACVWVPIYGWADGLFHSIFHSVAALCNAGISTIPNGLITYRSNVTINIVVLFLLILGSSGYVVIYELVKRLLNRHNKQRTRLSLHVRVVFISSIILLIVGTLGIFAFEYNNPEVVKDTPLAQAIMISFFQSATCRSCGYNTADVSSFQPYTKQFMMALMFIGGATGSTASGIKVTTFAILIMATWAHIRGKRDIEMGDRRIPWQRVAHATSLTIIAFFTVILAIVTLCYLEPQLDYGDIVFDAVSALGTVGLSTGVPAKCGVPAKLVLCICMFIGRIGPITLAMSLMSTPRFQYTTLPEGNVLIG